MIIFVTLILVTLTLIYLWFRSKFSFWSDRGFITPPPKIPFGNFSDFGKKHMGEIIKELYDEYKGQSPVLGMYIFGGPSLLLMEPEIIKNVYTRNFDSFHERGVYVNQKDDPLSAHLFALGGQQWRDVRVQLTPTFTSGKTKMMFETVLKECDKMIDYLKSQNSNNEAIEMKQVLSGCTTQVIASVAFGLEIECLGNPDNKFSMIGKEIFTPSSLDNFKNMIMNLFPDFGRKLKMTALKKESIEYFLETIRSTVEYREKNNVERKDFLQLLINLKKEQGMSIEDMAAHSFVFFAAGYETSSSVAMFALNELAINPEIQDKVRTEVEEIMSKNDDELTYEGVKEMKYLEQVFKETLRKFPVLDLQMRKSTKDYEIPDTTLTIPANTMILVSTSALHNDERFWENPSKFDPERFSPENEKNIPSYAYIPFSEGPRICIGQRFGTMQTKMMLAKLIKKFQILPSEKTQNPIKLDPNAGLQSPLGGMWLKLKNL